MGINFYCYRCKYKCEARADRAKKCPNPQCQRWDWYSPMPLYRIRNGGKRASLKRQKISGRGVVDAASQRLASQ